MTVTPNVQPDPPRIKVRSPADLVAAVPYLLGFHPADSVVVVAFRDRQLVFAARRDLPGSGERPGPAARELVDAVARQCVTTVVILGYGAPDHVDATVHAVRAAAERRGLVLRDALRVDQGRWWSYHCDEPRCCPPEGTPFDPTTSAVAAGFAFEGRAALPSREDVAKQVAPIDGLSRMSMTRATDRAEAEFRSRFGRSAAGAEVGAAVLSDGTAAVRDAIARYAVGGSLDDDELARLTVLLVSVPVRDVAWRAITSDQPHLRLWTDVTRRADPELVPAPASLLAFTAWRSGDGALAAVALDRALREDPSYSMANLLAHGLRHGLPPSALDGWPPGAAAERSPRSMTSRRRSGGSARAGTRRVR